MTLLEAFDLCKQSGTENIKNCIALYEDLKDDRYYTVQFGSTYPDEKLFFRWRLHDMSGTSYGKMNFINEMEASILYCLQISPWSCKEIENLGHIDFVCSDLEVALEKAQSNGEKHNEPTQSNSC